MASKKEVQKDSYKAPKYPRILVSPERHAALMKEAKEKKISVAELAEAKFKKAK